MPEQRVEAVRVRGLAARDIDAVLELQRVCYPVLSQHAAWGRKHFESHLARFPEGQLLASAGRAIVGYSASFIVPMETALAPHSFRSITGSGTFDTHDPAGDALYGAEIMVHPDHRRHGVARRLYAARFELARRLNLRCFVAGGRIPGFHRHAEKMTPARYVARVQAGEIEDRVLSAQLRMGLQVRGVLEDYLTDPKSRNHATLLVWENPDWRPARASHGFQKP